MTCLATGESRDKSIATLTFFFCNSNYCNSTIKRIRIVPERVKHCWIASSVRDSKRGGGGGSGGNMHVATCGIF